MGLFSKDIVVPPNTAGVVFKDSQFQEVLWPGKHRLPNSDSYLTVMLPQVSKMLLVTNQEVLSKDNIAFRFSYFVFYRIADPKLFLEKVNFDRNGYNMIYEAEQKLQALIQIEIRNILSGLQSEELNEQRSSLTTLRTDRMDAVAADLGLELLDVTLRDLTFPKNIQDLFAKQLESKIRSKTDLENARTVVATARALKNAAEMMKDDENMRFMHYLETISKIAEKGKHSFVIGDRELWKGDKS